MSLLKKGMSCPIKVDWVKIRNLQNCSNKTKQSKTLTLPILILSEVKAKLTTTTKSHVNNVII